MLYRNYFKRLVDISASAGCLLVLTVPLAVVTLWLHFSNKGAGAFFLQERPGRGGKIFKIVKFKSMTDERDVQGNLLPDKDRLTRAGRFVRATSIDELPQLWNVLKGEMSLIGPRPLLTQYIPWYTEEEMHRHDVRPGITGYAQSHGRNNITWDEKLRLDVYYVNHLTFKMDCDIVVTTFLNVIKRKDVEVANTEGPFDLYRQEQLKH